MEAIADHRRVVSVIMYRVDSIDRDNASAMLNVINEFTGNIWTEAVPESLDAIITTAIEKSMTHHLPGTLLCGVRIISSFCRDYKN